MQNGKIKYNGNHETDLHNGADSVPTGDIISF